MTALSTTAAEGLPARLWSPVLPSASITGGAAPPCPSTARTGE
ncbi:hypothetical protein AB0F36_16875 [Streptomyces sp. NPDC029080]|nr:hypothetical protein [Streptomyces sp. SID486]